MPTRRNKRRKRRRSRRLRKRGGTQLVFMVSSNISDASIRTAFEDLFDVDINYVSDITLVGNLKRIRLLNPIGDEEFLNDISNHELVRVRRVQGGVGPNRWTHSHVVSAERQVDDAENTEVDFLIQRI